MDWELAQAVKYLLCKHEVLNPDFQHLYKKKKKRYEKLIQIIMSQQGDPEVD